MKAALVRFARCRRGASAVEFAIIAVPLFLLLFGIIEFSRAMWIREAISQTAIAAARCVGIPQSQCAADGAYDEKRTVAFVEAKAKGWYITLAPASISIDTAASCSGVSGFTRITLNYTFRSVVPELLTVMSGPIQLSASACFPNHS